jgi:hypothetical protein
VNSPANQTNQPNQDSESEPIKNKQGRSKQSNLVGSRSSVDTSDSNIDSFTSEHKRGIIVITSVVIGLFCLLGLLSPDGRTFEKEFRKDVANGTQLKDVVAYCKERDLPWTWDRSKRQLIILLQGHNWIPIVKVNYKESVFFDNFNRLHGRSGSMEYSWK